MIFDTRVHGIPCLCRVTHFRPYEPADLSGHPDNATAPIGSEFEYQILDKRGRYAPWLERYLTSQDNTRLEEEFLLEVRAEDYRYPHF